MSPSHLMSCPSCGAQLTHFVGHPDAAPWICAPCQRGFWAAELSHEARARYRPLFHDWGHGPEAVTLRASVLAEREVARRRGTSALPDHLPLMNVKELQHLQRRPLDPEFKQQVVAAHKQRTS